MQQSKFSIENITQNQKPVISDLPQEKRNFQHLIKNPPPMRKSQVIEGPQSEHQLPTYSLLQMWDNVLLMVQQQQFDKAYRTILQSEDDIYLMRLMSITGPCVKKLTPETAQLLSLRMKKLMMSEFWKMLGLKVFKGVQEANIQMPPQENDKIKELLYKWSSSWTPEISFESAQLSNNLG